MASGMSSNGHRSTILSTFPETNNHIAFFSANIDRKKKITSVITHLPPISLFALCSSLKIWEKSLVAPSWSCYEVQICHFTTKDVLLTQKSMREGITCPVLGVYRHKCTRHLTTIRGTSITVEPMQNRRNVSLFSIDQLLISVFHIYWTVATL